MNDEPKDKHATLWRELERSEEKVAKICILSARHCNFTTTTRPRLENVLTFWGNRNECITGEKVLVCHFTHSRGAEKSQTGQVKIKVNAKQGGERVHSNLWWCPQVILAIFVQEMCQKYLRAHLPMIIWFWESRVVICGGVKSIVLRRDVTFRSVLRIAEGRDNDASTWGRHKVPGMKKFLKWVRNTFDFCFHTFGP